MDKGILFYDLEVFKYDSLAVFKYIDGSVCMASWNDDPNRPAAITDIVRNNIIVGYNNYGYDDKVLTVMMNPALSSEDRDAQIKLLNDLIINGINHASYTVSPLIKSLDAMQQIDVGHPSLKQIEGNLGMSIDETQIPFDIDRPLTPEEREQTEFYCCHDVDATIEVYKLRKKSYFDVKESLIAMLPEEDREKAARWNTTTISANLLQTGDTSRWSEHKVPDRFWGDTKYIPQETWDMWASIDLNNVTDKGKFVTTTLFDCEVTFGVGGLHGAPISPETFDDGVIDLDVSSMYPSIISLEELSPLKAATPVYNQMRTDRIACKKSDPIRAAALKLILNSVYGNFKNKYSSLYNPFASVTVCVYGMIAAIGLCAKLYEAGYRITNINTDGVMFLPNPDASRDYLDIKAEWESEYGLGLEVEKIDRMIQRDVNNYIAVEGGKIKAKGGDVNKYGEDHFFKNNDCRIVHIALVEYLVNGTPIDDTFATHIKEPSLWQYVLKAGPTYRAVRDSEGHDMNKVNRVFAAKPGTPGATELKKWKADGTSSKFADAPEVMYVWNKAIDEIENFENIIDTSHYKAIVERKIEAWHTTKKRPVKREKKDEPKQNAAKEQPAVVVIDRTNELETIAKHFRGARKKSETNWIAYCPIHEADGEHSPSLAIYRKKNGKGIRCSCMSRQCKQADILKAVGLTFDDLHSYERTNDDWKSALAADLSVENDGKEIKIAAYYDYTDAAGEYIHTKVRYYIGDDPKKHMMFIQKVWNDDATYYKGKNKLHPDPVLYNVKELLKTIAAGYPVFYVEGEKDVETLRQHGKTATTAGGTGDWQPELAEYFRGAYVTIIADNDEAGHQLADKVKHDIAKFAFAVRIVTPSRMEKGDITDYFEKEGTDDSFKAFLEYNCTWDYASFVVEGKTGNTINEGILSGVISRNEKPIVVKSPDNRPQIYMYDGRSYAPSAEEIGTLVQRYIPEAYLKKNTVANVSGLIKEKPGIQMSWSNVEKDVDEIIVENGVLTFEDGQPHLKQHNRDAKIITCIKAKYDSEAACPTFMKYIRDLCTDYEGNVDEDKVKVILEYCGMIISNHHVLKSKKALVLVSEQGNTGKSQLLNILAGLIGEDKVANIDLQTMDPGNKEKGNNFALSAIVGKRLAQSPDESASFIRRSTVFKQLLGGDTISVEKKQQGRFNYKFAGGVIICCNGVPSFTDDRGNHIAERMIIVPCEHHLEEGERDTEIVNKILAERSGVLNVLLEGMLRYLKNGKFTIPASSVKAADEYKAKSDSVYAFVSNPDNGYEMTHDDKDRVKVTDFDAAYELWYRAEHPDEAADKSFIVKKSNIKERLLGYGIVSKKSRFEGSIVMAYRGIKKIS